MPRKVKTAGPAAAAQPDPASICLVNTALRRFPWPANPRQRYSFEAPYLAVVNARGPWKVWRHGAANPPFIPLSLDLLAKGFWKAADDGQRVFAITVWAQAAREDDWGIVWGDPVRLVHAWGLNAATFIARLDWMIEMGLAVYLTHEEAAATRSWRPGRGQNREGEGGSKRGEEQGQASSSQAIQDKQDQDQEKEQGSSQPAGSARAPTASQLPGSSAKGKNQEQEQARQEQDQGQPQAKPKQSTAQQAQEGLGASPQAAKLPKSDQGSGNGPAGHARSPAVCSTGEAVQIGQILSAKQIAWQNPLAVDFARHIVGSITGRPCSDDLATADARLLMDLGPWVYYWVESVQNSLAAQDFQAFRERCVRDIAKKRRYRGIKNLGGLARAEIVPGVLRAMTGGKH
jgi:hypothetical protein